MVVALEAGLARGTATAWATMSDLELARASSSDPDAFAELVRRHQEFVFGAVLRIVRDRTLAEDLAQEAFLRAYGALDRFRGDAAVRSWLYRIGTNLAKNATARRREYPSDALPDRPTSVGRPAHEMEQAAIGADLHAALAALPDDLREPLVLYEFDGLTYQEIADRASLPLNTVRTRIHRAKRTLRKVMHAWR